MFMGRLRMAVRPVGRADAALPQAYRSEAVPLSPLRALLLPLRPPGASREASRVARVPTPASRQEPQEEVNFETAERLNTSRSFKTIRF